MERFLSILKEYFKNRLFLVFAAFTLSFCIIALRLFSLQIVHGEDSQQELTASITRTLTIPASRGNIYDRYGRPLAMNKVAFSVQMDDSITSPPEGLTNLAVDMASYLAEKGTPVGDTLPISKEAPRQFLLNETETRKWLAALGLKKKQLEMTADEVYAYLLEAYEFPEGLSADLQRQALSLRLDLSDKNLMLASFLTVLEKNGDVFADDLPITATQPYTFNLNGSASRERTFKTDISMEGDELLYTAQQTMDYLYDLFEIPNSLPETLRRSLASVRYALYLQRWRKYQPVTVALDVSSETVAEIEEAQTSYPGVTVSTDSMRVYPYGEYFSHIIGYIRKISDTEYETYQDYGYSATDIVGKSGVEKLKELELNGTDGEMLVEVDAVGRRISSVETAQPVSGQNVYLTLDAELQTVAYDALEAQLVKVLKNRLLGQDKNAGSVTLKELFISMVNSNNISIPGILAAADGERATARTYIYNAYPDYNPEADTDYALAKQVLCDNIESGRLSAQQMVLILYEEGRITADASYLAGIKNGSISPLTVILQKLDAREIRPSDTNLDPCTGSVVVTDVNTGDVLALVTYPSYDNNRFVNHFDNAYWNDLLNDPDTPMVNRALSQKKAPGSTLKMITAIAALESGAITRDTIIKAEGIYTKTGIPYANCWIYPSTHATHGEINVVEALEVSCNYFFYETAYRMGNQEAGTSANSILTLNEYMDAFGLNDYTGIEIGDDLPNMATPSYKEYITKMYNPEATSTQTRWTDGDTIRAAIGQSVNNFAPAHMAKYIATLANGGTRFTMHLIDKVETAEGVVTEQTETQVENVLAISDSTLEAVREGMYRVSKGTKGTLRHVFGDYPVNVASKSGTAEEEENRSSHVWYVGYAPLEDPQIAVVVMIPYGDASSSPSAYVAKEVISSYMGLDAPPSVSTRLETTLMP